LPFKNSLSFCSLSIWLLIFSVVAFDTHTFFLQGLFLRKAPLVESVFFLGNISQSASGVSLNNRVFIAFCQVEWFTEFQTRKLIVFFYFKYV
jgi:hypothetical protein